MLDIQGRHGRKIGNSLQFNQGKILEEYETVGFCNKQQPALYLSGVRFDSEPGGFFTNRFP